MTPRAGDTRRRSALRDHAGLRRDDDGELVHPRRRCVGDELVLVIEMYDPRCWPPWVVTSELDRYSAPTRIRGLARPR